MSRRSGWRVALAASTVSLIVAVPFAAAGPALAQYPPGVGIECVDFSLDVGQELDCTAAGFDAGEPVLVRLVPVGPAAAGAGGAPNTALRGSATFPAPLSDRPAPTTSSSDRARGEEGSARGEEGSARGEDGSARGEDGSARGEDGSARGEDGSARGEDGSARGEEGSARGEDGSARGEEGRKTVVLGTYTADGNGRVSVRVDIPENVRPGEYDLQFIGKESGRRLIARVSVSGDDDHGRPGDDDHGRPGGDGDHGRGDGDHGDDGDDSHEGDDGDESGDKSSDDDGSSKLADTGSSDPSAALLGMAGGLVLLGGGAMVLAQRRVRRRRRVADAE